MMITFQKLALALATPLVLLSATAQTRKVELSGNISGLAGREVAIFGNGDFKSPIVKVNGLDDSFKITVPVSDDDAAPYYLNIPAIGGFGPSMKIPSFMLFLDGKSMTVDASIADYRITLNGVKGSAFMDEYNRLDRENEHNEGLDKALKDYNEAFDVYNVKGDQSEASRQRLSETSNHVSAMYKKKGAAFIAMIPRYPKNKALAFHIHNYYGGAPLSEKKRLLASFDSSIHNSYPLARLAEGIRLEEGATVGNPLPDFETYTVDGKLDKLANYKGEYLLIDFWASWCGPCIKEIPNLKAVYKDYKDKGLRLIGISVDDSQDKWKKAIHEHGLDYLQLHDTTKKTGKLLNYQGIPFIILVSPDGTILERGLRGEDVREKIKKYLN